MSVLADEVEVLQVWNSEGVRTHTTQDPGRPPHPPPRWQRREQNYPGRSTQVPPGIAPTMSKKAAKAARKEAAAAAASGLPTPRPSERGSGW